MPDMQCTLFPELWIHNCCVAHDLGTGDLPFLQCLISSTAPVALALFLAFPFSVFIGMFIGRPIRRFIQSRKNKDDQPSKKG